LSNKEQITGISSSLAEPSWLLAWRENRASIAENLPKTLKYGLGIDAHLPADHYKGSLSTAEYHVDASKGLEVYTWKEAVNQEEIAPILKGLMESELFPVADNYFDGNAQAVFGSGVVVYVQPNLNEKDEFVTEKLTLDTLLPDGTSSDIVIVIAKEGSKLDFTSVLTAGASGSLFSRTLAVVTEKDAEVRLAQKDTLVLGATAHIKSRAIVAAHSSVQWFETFIGAANIRSATEHLLVGESAATEIAQGLIATAETRLDIAATVKHLSSYTRSRIMTAGIAKDTSHTIYRGLIDMKQGVSDVNGTEEAKFLVLSPTAKVDAIPALDIAAKEVQCSHKLSVTHVKEGDMFYPKLRGLSDVESRRLFLSGHFAGVLAGENGELHVDIAQKLDTL
jgi:Fe-S cluster assembly protein SufD